MSFNCYDSLGHKITTVSYLDCNPSLDITMTASEFAKIANAQSASLTVAELFAVPATPDLQTVFMSGMSLPLILYLVAWAFGVVLNFINEK